MCRDALKGGDFFWRVLMNRLFSTRILVSVFFFGAFSGVVRPTEGQHGPRRVVLFVVDGAGIGMWSLANFQTENVSIRQFPVVGLVDTRSAYGIYPGSAAAGTSFAIGERTFTGAIGVGTDSLPRRSVLEVAQERGLATGLVSTANITDATPAAFSAHVVQRADEAEIARQQSEKNITVLMGGGRRYFDARGRPDSVDLIALFRERHTYVETDSELRALNLESVSSLYGLFTWADMPVYPDRSPSLSTMAAAALQVLDKDPDGFFLLLETESTDTETHHNVEFDVLAGEMLDVENTVRLVLEYQRNNPETLFILLGDHDTGGLAIQRTGARTLLTRTAAQLDTAGVRLGESAKLLDNEGSHLVDSTRIFIERMSTGLRRRASDLSAEETLVARYTTGSHTANMVPLFANGPESERFGGVIDNFRVGRLLLEIVGREE
jgi:alkaline phosphatase